MSSNFMAINEVPPSKEKSPSNPRAQFAKDIFDICGKIVIFKHPGPPGALRIIQMKELTMRRMPICLLLLSVVSFAAPIQESVGKSQSERDAKSIAAVRIVLNAQKDAWNRGDIEGYMEGYARAPDIVFISGDSVTRGWQTVHDRYKKTYDSREKMGTLAFSDLETNVLSNDAAVTIGRWHLQRANDEPHGRFTLIFRRLKQGWRIVHDHTSSAQ